MGFLNGAFFVLNLAMALHFARKREAFVAWVAVFGAMMAGGAEAIRWLA